MPSPEAHNVSRSGIPIVVVGRGADVMINVVTALKPEYDAVHTCVEVDSAVDELPELLSGSQNILPASNIGSNMSRNTEEYHPLPKAVLVGGGISHEQYEQIQQAVSQRLATDTRGQKVEVRWLKVTLEDYPPEVRGQEPPLGLIIQVAKKLLSGIASVSE